MSAAAAAVGEQGTRTVVIAVREFGPVIWLLSSAALVEGGTEVALQVTVYSEPGAAQPRSFTVEWRRGGTGVVAGVAGLSGDMRSALEAGLRPGTVAR